MVGNGTDRPVNTSLVRVVNYDNGTQAAFINGTLDNGTTAPGGTEPSDDSEFTDSAAGKLLLNYTGYWVMVATVVAAVCLA